jgi:hypothetical protein
MFLGCRNYDKLLTMHHELLQYIYAPEINLKKTLDVLFNSFFF